MANIIHQIMFSLSILQDNKTKFSKWALSSYSVSLRSITSLVERTGRLLAAYYPFFSHGHQAWNEYSKWGWMNVPYSIWKSAKVIFIIDALMALIIEFRGINALAMSHVRLIHNSA